MIVRQKPRSRSGMDAPAVGVPSHCPDGDSGERLQLDTPGLAISQPPDIMKEKNVCGRPYTGDCRYMHFRKRGGAA